MRFHAFEFEFSFEKISDKILINAVLAGIDIGGKKTAFGKGVDADMTLGDDHKTAPAAWILDMIVRRRDNRRPHERTHAEGVANLGEGRENRFLAIETIRIPAITVNGDVFAEMG